MEGKLANATESTGGVNLLWSTRLRTAAGRAHWTRQRGMKDQHNLQIELSTKIITDEGTVLKTMACMRWNFWGLVCLCVCDCSVGFFPD